MIEDVEAEFGGAELGDARLGKRLVRLAGSVARKPHVGFPQMMDEAGLEATYRFLGNEKVTPEAILEPHRRKTAERMSHFEEVLALHDSTSFSFSGDAEREDLGVVSGNGQGFMAHFTLGVVPGEERRVLGVAGLSTIVREKRKRRGSKRKKLVRDRPGAEQARWGTQALEVASLCPASTRLIHVMDREADDFALFHELKAAKQDFVIRSSRPRRLADEPETTLRDYLEQTRLVLARDVHLARRKAPIDKPHQKVHPARASRPASLRIHAGTVLLKSPQRVAPLEPLKLNVVWVTEPEPPDAQKPVDWCLLTTLPVRTKKDVERVVDAYRSRWVIEDYFKALKTGCAYEQRQLESLQTLLNALAVFAPIACTLLELRALGREQGARPATDVLSADQITILRAVSKRKLPPNLTAADALFAVAALGGHIKNNGLPGWQTLGQGFQQLLVLEEGFRLAKRYDQ